MTEPITAPRPTPEKSAPAPAACQCHEDAEQQRSDTGACQCHEDAALRLPPAERVPAPPPAVRVQRFTVPAAGPGETAVQAPPARKERASWTTPVLGVILALPLLVLAAAFLVSGLLPAAFVALALFLPALAPLLLVILGVLLTETTPALATAPVPQRPPAESGRAVR